MSKQYLVNYTAYEGQNTSYVLSEGEITVTAGSAQQAENQVKAMFGGGGTNTVITRGVFDL